MSEKPSQEFEVGDLFVTETALTLKLLPSRKSATVPIRWFAKDGVTNVRRAAKDIQHLVGRLQGANRVVRSLTVMTDQGRSTDLIRTRLVEAVSKAGFEVLP
ncbi:MAG TPA: hypothetical protein DCZ01_13055 [Elusimicrobia bacterium]|nr:MAG: hypothetical protein A2X37_04455 [Elusimicrobia bacterium GWA2_66_18]OGR69905.1 MAG: hypothetical protein A2X40_10355 [Elusimicrobia bacterium GWC2_65_9]HAZ09411.1 hypothetical protein [Elusimicrobiota bacterium]